MTTLTAAMQVICMTTDSDDYHMDMKFKRKFLYHFSPLKVIPQKTKFNIECLDPFKPGGPMRGLKEGGDLMFYMFLESP